MKQYLLLFLLLPAVILRAQQVRQPLTSNYAGLGAYSKNFVDVLSSSTNQASLAQLKNSGFAVLGERRFLLDELSQYSAVVTFPTGNGTVALQTDYFGSSAYNESQLGLAYGRKITKSIDVGVKFNYLMMNIAGYGKASTINFEVGGIIHLTDNLSAGLHVYNPLSSKLGKTGTEKTAAIYKFGLGYEVSDKVLLTTEIVKQEDMPVGVNAGVQYNLHEKVFVRSGVATTNKITYAGVGFKFNIFRLDLTASYHQQLGVTPGLLLFVNFNKGDK